MPQGELEQAVAAIWCEVLGVSRVSRNDNFFELGGHSLLAVQLVSRLNLQLGAAVSLRTIFEMNSLTLLAASIAAQRASAGPSDEEKLNDLESFLDTLESV